MNNMKKQAGFTLIEILIYIAIISGVVVTFVVFSLSISNSRNKTYVIQEVQANTRVAFELISKYLHAADDINIGASIFDSDPGVLSLAMDDAGKNPTIISLNADDGQLQIKEGSADEVNVTSNEVKITNLVFRDLTGSSARKNIGVEVTVEYNVDNSDVIYEYAQSWQTAVSLRQ